MGKVELWPEQSTKAWLEVSCSSFLARHIYISVSHPHPNPNPICVPLFRPVLYHVGLFPKSEIIFSRIVLFIALIMEEISVYEASINIHWPAQFRRLPNLFTDFDSIFNVCT
jgi:hypothetical protein